MTPSIKHNGKTYLIEICDGDILLFDSAKFPSMTADLCLYGYADELRSEAIFHCTYGDSEEGIDYDNADVKDYINDNLEEFTARNFEKADKPEDEETEMTFI